MNFRKINKKKSAYDNDIAEVLVTEKELKEITKRLGEEISCDHEGQELVIVCVLRGSIIATADIVRNIRPHCTMDFMVASSYFGGTETSGSVLIKKDLETDIKGKHVVIIEDILDSGFTLSLLRKELLKREPASLKICALLDKPEKRVADIQADYVGKVIENKFVVGYGLDYDEKYRNIPYVGVLKESVYSKSE